MCFKELKEKAILHNQLPVHHSLTCFCKRVGKANTQFKVFSEKHSNFIFKPKTCFV
jgi:hypothetical protein